MDHPRTDAGRLGDVKIPLRQNAVLGGLARHKIGHTAQRQ
jgi:hypothetical protein